MKKIIITAFIFLFTAFTIVAQDLIIKRNGEEIKAKVRVVSATEVEYAKSESLDGPIYKVAKSDILLIMYSNGTKDIFSNEPANTITANSPDNSEKKDAPKPSALARPVQRYYNYDFFDKKVPLVYLGIDYSYSKLDGQDFEAPKALFYEINALIMKENSKYDMNGAVRRSILRYQYAIVDKRNQAVNESALSENITNVIRFEDLQNIIDEYDLSLVGMTDGLALVVICENLSIPRADGAYYYVVFDVASKKIVISDRLTGRAGGNGQRNYWARSVYETITQLRDKRYGQWKMMNRR